MKNILVVDDNPQNLYLLQSLLGANGYEIATAANGAEALEKAHCKRPDMVVADILMPVMDGFELCRRWMRDDELKGVPFVFYTATYTDSKDEELALGLGAARFIVKPQEPEAFLKALNEVLAACETDRLPPPSPPPMEEEVYIREYNEALIRKLEAKMFQLEDANRCLEKEIAERKEAEADLRRLATAIEQTGEIVIITDAEGTIQYLNPAFETVTGYRREEALGRNPRLWKSGRHDPAFYRNLWGTISSGKS
jgi:CheY-like chemotaxis protein